MYSYLSLFRFLGLWMSAIQRFVYDLFNITTWLKNRLAWPIISEKPMRKKWEINSPVDLRNLAASWKNEKWVGYWELNHKEVQWVKFWATSLVMVSFFHVSTPLRNALVEVTAGNYNHEQIREVIQE